VKLFLDTNVVLDVLADRAPWSDESSTVLTRDQSASLHYGHRQLKADSASQIEVALERRPCGEALSS
jgi:hypothetical protein